MDRTNKGGISRERVERAARIYSSNRAAAEALGIRPGSFSRLCKKYEIESPQKRKERERGHKRSGTAGRPSTTQDEERQTPAGPIEYDDDGYIINGHARQQALKDMGAL